MSQIESIQLSKWAELLASGSVEDQIDTLRQVSGQQRVPGITTLVVTLSGSHDDEIRRWASEALESSIEPHISDIPRLSIQVQSQDDGEVCYWAATMLGRLGVESASAVGALQCCLATSMYLPALERATWALSQIGAQALSAKPALSEAAATGPPRLRRLASEALKVIEREGTGDSVTKAVA